MVPVVVIVRVEDPVPVMEAGGRVDEAPEGRSMRDGASLPVKQ